MNLSEKETYVLMLIFAGTVFAFKLAEKTETTTNSVNAVITSLVKKGLVIKNEDKTVSLTEEGKGMAESMTGFTNTTVDKNNNPDDSKNANTEQEPNNDASQSFDNSKNGEPLSQKSEASSFDPLLRSKVEDSDSQSETKQPITILIPYLKSEAAGEELRYALRAWEQNFKQPHRIVVIGDSEPWFSPEIIHIPHTPHLVKEDCNCPAPSMVRNPQADVTHKIFTAIAAGEITGDFILTNDDIYLLGATQLSDIESLKAFGSLVCPENTNLSLYHRNSNRTAKILESENLPTHRYGTHTPMVLNAEKLIEVIEKYKALDNGYLLTSLYFNEVYPDARPIQVTGGANDPILASAYRHDISAEVLKDVFRSRKFINCNSKGWKAIEPFLKNLYQSPSRFEK